jgi:hypothetical protein
VGGREGEWFPVFVAPATAVSGLAVGFLFLLRSTFFFRVCAIYFYFK